MIINRFSAKVFPGREEFGGYVRMNHAQTYSLILHNYWNERADAKVSIDGKEIGTFRIPANSSITLERPLNDEGRFTFFKQGTKKFAKAGLEQVPDEQLGLIRVEFLPEKPVQVTYMNTLPYYVWPTPPENQYWITNTYNSSDTAQHTGSLCMASASPGGTGVSGHSDQNFGCTDAIWNPDFSRQTIITLRLVSVTDEELATVRPLVPWSNQVPPPVRS
jgi:hypothetical protein